MEELLQKETYHCKTISGLILTVYSYQDLSTNL